MGGIPANSDGQVLSNADGDPVVGFYAAGEVSCISVHGANRLGTNSLLGASLFGRRAGKSMAEFIKSGAELYPLPGDPVADNLARIDYFKNAPVAGKPERYSQIAAELKETMTKNCGVFRDDARLRVALADIKALQERFKNVRVMDKTDRFNNDVLGALETEHLLTFSRVIVESGLARTESRGAHFRTDFPKRDDENWLKHTMAHQNAKGEPVLSYKSVNIDFEKYPPQERKY
jgi:succinate dehydrogenase / fumarate reductase flavoprotein subunit